MLPPNACRATSLPHHALAPYFLARHRAYLPVHVYPDVTAWAAVGRALPPRQRLLTIKLTHIPLSPSPQKEGLSWQEAGQKTGGHNYAGVASNGWHPPHPVGGGTAAPAAAPYRQAVSTALGAADGWTRWRTGAPATSPHFPHHSPHGGGNTLLRTAQCDA